MTNHIKKPIPKIKPSILSIQIFDLDNNAILNNLVSTLPISKKIEKIIQKDIKVDPHGSILIYSRKKLDNSTVLLVAIKIDSTSPSNRPNSSTNPLL